MIKRIAMTGAPGSGKSSINRVLEFYYKERIIPEAAEDMIKTLIREGYEKPWEILDFQDQILKLQLQRENQLIKLEGRVFIDRGIIDQLAYYQIQNRSYSEALKKALEEHPRYSRILLIERGEKCEQNGIRREDAEEAKIHQELHLKNYREAGYETDIIPWMDSPKERADYIIELLKGGEIK